MVPLTPKQQKFLKYLQQFIREKGYAPTLQDMAHHFRLSSLGTVQQYLEALELKGYIKRSSKARGLQVLKTSAVERFSVEGGVEVPILGKVAAGKPIEHHKSGEKRLVPQWMMKKQGSYFLLQVQGDSMIDEGIREGDLVIVHRQAEAESGQIVVAVIEEEATIKKFIRKKNGIELHSANPHYAPLLIPEGAPLRIEGIYCGLLRGP